MKRYLSLFLVFLLTFAFLTACQKADPQEQDDSIEISQSDRKLIEDAIKLLEDEWEVIAVEDECNNGYLEIKNTRLLHTDSDAIANALGVDGVENIVEFVIFTDYYGAAPYYYETQYMNNVVFFSDGSSSVITNAVQMYSARTYDAALENCSFTVTDCASAFNQTFDFGRKAEH